MLQVFQVEVHITLKSFSICHRMLGYKEEMLFAEDKCSGDVHVSLEDSNTIKMRNENVCAKGGVAPIGEKIRENHL